jgi:hypothetical protein
MRITGLDPCMMVRMNGFRYRRLVAQAIIGASSFVSMLPSNSVIDFSGIPTRAQDISDNTCQSVMKQTSLSLNTLQRTQNSARKRGNLSQTVHVPSAITATSQKHK